VRQVELAARPGRQVVVMGRLHEVAETNAATGSVVLRRLDTGSTLRYTTNEFAMMVANQHIEFADEVPRPARRIALDFTALEPEVVGRIERRLYYVRSLLPLRDKGPRNAHLRLAIQEAAHRIEDPSPPSPHTVYRWVKRYVESGYDVGCLAVEALVKRTRASRLPPRVREALLKHAFNALKGFKKRSLRSLANDIFRATAQDLGFTHFLSVRREVYAVEEEAPAPKDEVAVSVAALASHRHTTSDRFVLRVSYESLRVIAKAINRADLANARWGRTVAENEFAPRTGEVEVWAPLERVETDNFLLDVHVRCPFTGAILGRAWLTLAIDVFSGLAAGYYISFGPPSAESVIATLRHAVQPKPPEGLHRRIPVPDGFEWLDLPAPESPCAGVMSSIVFDNGSDYVSAQVRAVLQNLGVEPIFTPPRTPWYKGAIESFGRTVNIQFIHWLPGTTFGDPMRGREYDPQRDATITYPHLVQLLEHFLHGILPYQTKRRATLSPRELWRQGVERFPVRIPLVDDQFQAALSLTYTRTLSQTGVELHGLLYNNGELGTLWHRVGPKQKVGLRLDPTDIRTLLVVRPDNGELLRVPCVTQFKYPRTLTYHLQYRAWCREEGHDPDDVRTLERNERLLNEQLARAKKYGKALMRRLAHLSQTALAAEAELDERTEPSPAASPESKHVDDFASLLAATNSNRA
jgi:putative transposase